MITEDDLHDEITEITQFIKYSVAEEDQEQALSFLGKHKKDSVMLTLLREFYSALPEGIEEPVTQDVPGLCRQGAYLLAVTTNDHQYLYFADVKRATYICRLGEAIDRPDILNFFDYQDSDELVKDCQELREPDEFDSQEGQNASSCTVCFVEQGEYHTFGCPVEVCPWCDGQLTNCNCRFDKLGVDEIVDEELLNNFFKLLSGKGRVPIKKGDCVAYPSDSRGVQCDPKE